MNIKKKYWKRITAVARVLVVVFSLLALIVSGASAAVRAFSAASSGVQAPDSRLENLLTPTPSPDEGGEAMTPSSRPNTEQAGLLTMPAWVNQVKYDDRFRVCLQVSSEVEQLSGCTAVERAPVGSTCLISSMLGRQFTLVGAKPSGTS